MSFGDLLVSFGELWSFGVLWCPCGFLWGSLVTFRDLWLPFVSLWGCLYLPSVVVFRGMWFVVCGLGIAMCLGYG